MHVDQEQLREALDWLVFQSDLPRPPPPPPPPPPPTVAPMHVDQEQLRLCPLSKVRPQSDTMADIRMEEDAERAHSPKSDDAIPSSAATADDPYLISSNVECGAPEYAVQHAHDAAHDELVNIHNKHGTVATNTTPESNIVQTEVVPDANERVGCKRARSPCNEADMRDGEDDVAAPPVRSQRKVRIRGGKAVQARRILDMFVDRDYDMLYCWANNITAEQMNGIVKGNGKYKGKGCGTGCRSRWLWRSATTRVWP